MKNKFLSSSDNMSKNLKHNYLNSIKSKFKRNKLLLPYILLFLGFMSFILFYKMEYSAASTALAKNTIRFHVRANSDTVIDQTLKLKVKDAVVDYIYRETKELNSLKEYSLFITTHNEKILNIAQKTIDENGFDYNVTSKFGKDDFPKKTYGDVVYPEGEYTSYTIYIGKGKGHNWWCVLYPQLCFVDASSGTVPDSSKERLKDSLGEREYKTIIKFKYLKFLNNFLD